MRLSGIISIPTFREKSYADSDKSGIPSVFFLVVESLSRVNAHHQLNKTISVLKDTFNATIFDGG